jgi:UDP-sugar transporter A1/2/3
VPAFCYAIQNNLVFVAISNLSAAAAQVLYQTKTLSTAAFTVAILGKSFQPIQWASFALLSVGVVLVQSQDAKSSASPTGASPMLGVSAALSAATLSGFAGVYLEKMFTSGGSSLWMRNVQLCLFAIPLQVVTIYQLDREAVADGGLLQGFQPSTWAVVAVQVAGALLTAFVIKFAGNVLKTFATVLAILCTCFVSTFLFDFTPTLLFGFGVALTAVSIWMCAPVATAAAAPPPPPPRRRRRRRRRHSRHSRRHSRPHSRHSRHSRRRRRLASSARGSTRRAPRRAPLDPPAPAHDRLTADPSCARCGQVFEPEPVPEPLPHSAAEEGCDQ